MVDRLLPWLRRNWWLALVFGLIGSTIPVAYVLSPPSTVGFTGWIEVFGTVNSLLLSAILVVLYRQMSDTQKEQTQIMRKQDELEDRIEKLEPPVEIRSASVESDATETRIVTEVANKGEGPILDVQLGIDLVLYAMDGTKIGLSTEKSVVYDGAERIIEPRDVPFQREGLADATGATHLESGETATLVAPVAFEIRNTETDRRDRASFREVVNVLEATNVGMIKFHGSLLYANQNDEWTGKHLDSGKAELDSFETLDELLASERPHTKLPRNFMSG